MKDLNELAKQVHANSVEKGFWEDKPSDEHCLMLVITELSEAVEADRRGLYIKESDRKEIELHSDKNTFAVVFKDTIKNTLEDELADAFIRLLDLSGARHIELHIKDVPAEQCNHLVINHSFTDLMYLLTRAVSKWNDVKSVVEESMYFLMNICKAMDIDLFWHVETKMKYNQTREYKHGKKY